MPIPNSSTDTLYQAVIGCSIPLMGQHRVTSVVSEMMTSSNGLPAPYVQVPGIGSTLLILAGSVLKVH